MCKSNAGRCGRFAVALRQAAVASLIAASVHLLFADAAIAQVSASNGALQFDIPAQPFASALQAFGRTTGLELFYDGSLSIGRSSSGIKGTFAPMLALKELLRGTGYIARQTDIANTITIVKAPSTAPLHAMFDRYESYFALLQARVGEKLCDQDEFESGHEVTLRVWLDHSGLISQATLVGAGASDDKHRKITARILGIEIGKAPPTGLPEPLTMVVYPPAMDDTAACSSSDGQKTDKRSPR
jgi:hypothetical protein